MGANTAVITAVAMSTFTTSSMSTIPCINPRDAFARCDTGLTDTSTWSSRGIVFGSTKMLLAIVSGNSSRKLDVITDSGDFTSMPTMIHIHESDIANRMISATASTTEHSPGWSEPHDEPESDHHRRGERVAEHVAEQRTEDRRGLPDGHRAEAVEQALRDVGVESDAGVDGDENDGLHHDPRDEVLHVLLHAPGQRAAEQVGEHQRHHQRERRHVEQLEGDMLDLQHRPPAEGDRRRPGTRGARPRGGCEHAHATASCSPVALIFPVSAKNTSSRLGCPRVSSATPTPAEVSAASASCTRPLPSTRAVRVWASVPLCTPSPSTSRRMRSASVSRSASSSRRCSVLLPTELLSLRLVPSAMSLPWSITASRFASRSASSRYCVVRSTVVPPAAIVRTMSQTWLRLRGSSPVVGSSRKSTSGVTTRLAAMSSRRRMPPEYSRTCLAAASTRSNAASSSSARARAGFQP